jgi:hypothetical protein
LRVFQGKAHFVQRIHLEHEVMQQLRRGSGDQRQRVVTRVTVLEFHVERHAGGRFHRDDVGEAEALNVLVEFAGDVDGGRGQHEVAEALIAGDETADTCG